MVDSTYSVMPDVVIHPEQSCNQIDRMSVSSIAIATGCTNYPQVLCDEITGHIC